MPSPAECRPVARLPRTAFKPGQSGNPRGRVAGTLNKVTRDAREAAQRIVDDPEYLEALRARMIYGTAGQMEPLMWLYAKGKPIDRAHTENLSEIAACSNSELVNRLRAALKLLGSSDRVAS